MSVHDHEKNGNSIDNEAFKEVAENLLKNEKSLDSFMQLATSFLSNGSLLNSTINQRQRTVPKGEEEQTSSSASITENQEITKDILQELVAISNTLEEINNNITSLRKELKPLRTVSKRLRY